MFRLDALTPEERQEYEDLLAEAGLDDNGLPLPSSEIGQRMHDLLLDADRAGRPWAQWVLRDDAEAGHLRRFKAWRKAQEKIRVSYGGVIIPKAAVTSVKRKREDGSGAFHQLAAWAELSWPEIEAKRSEATSQRFAASINLATATRLLMLRDRVPDAATPRDACAALGIDFETYLLDDAAA